MELKALVGRRKCSNWVVALLSLRMVGLDVGLHPTQLVAETRMAGCSAIMKKKQHFLQLHSTLFASTSHGITYKTRARS